jgi:hypothetical protein
MPNIKLLTGVYRALVEKTDDPKKQNRVKLRLQTNPNGVTDWVSCMEPASVHTAAPAIGQGVWVMYEGGDPSFPVWFGEFGTHKAKNKKMFIKPLENTVSLSGLSNYLKTVNNPDGTVEVDLTGTLVAMANKLKDHETRIASLEAQIVTKASISHSH